MTLWRDLPPDKDRLVLRPSNPGKRWRVYLCYLAVCGIILIGAIIYTFYSISPSYWALVPIILIPYPLFSSLCGFRSIRAPVAYVNHDQFTSINWRGVVSTVSLTEIRKIAKLRCILKFRNRYFNWWSGYLGGTLPEDREAFVLKFLQYIGDYYPSIKLSRDLAAARRDAKLPEEESAIKFSIKIFWLTVNSVLVGLGTYYVLSNIHLLVPSINLIELDPFFRVLPSFYMSFLSIKMYEYLTDECLTA